MTVTAISTTSQTTQILNVLRSNAGIEMNASRVCDLLGIPLADKDKRHLWGIKLACAFNRNHAEDSPWLYVHRPRRGVYVFDPETKRDRKAAAQAPESEPTLSFVVLAEDNGAYVLRSPEGDVYTAKRLSA